MIESTSSTAAPAVPVQMAHFVIRTARFEQSIAWYRTVLGAEIVFRNEMLAFLRFDDEHHRLAIVHKPALRDSSEDIAGIDHVAFTFAALDDLLSTYARLKRAAIMPTYSYNHGMSTSLYYTDPDGNKVELQVDNFAEPADAVAFLQSPAFAENPIGVIFNPDELIEKRRRGVPAGELLRPIAS